MSICTVAAGPLRQPPVGMGELVYRWDPMGDFVGCSYYHWAAMESYVVHICMSIFSAGEPRVVPMMGCKY